MKKKILLDCSTCKSDATMEATKIPRCAFLVRVLGVIFLLPSGFGLAIVGFMFISTFNSQPGNIVGATVGITIGLPVTVMLLMIFVVGGFFLSTKKVYKCQNCGFVLNRA